MYSKLSSFVAAWLLVTLSACGDPVRVAFSDTTRYDSIVPWSGDPALKIWLELIRDSTWKFHHEALARAAGYEPVAASCETSSAGSSGLAYTNAALLGLVTGSQPITGTDSHIDHFHPEVLLYEPQEVGPHKFVGIKFVVYREAWESVHSEPPSVMGMRFDEKFGEDARGHADYYELHVWLWRNNPLGMISPWNPLVGC